jgi:hypothetical protein
LSPPPLSAFLAIPHSRRRHPRPCPIGLEARLTAGRGWLYMHNEMEGTLFLSRSESATLCSSSFVMSVRHIVLAYPGSVSPYFH